MAAENNNTQQSNPGIDPGIDINGLESVFTRFNPEEDIVEGSKKLYTEGIFTGGDGDITAFYTSSAQAALSSSNYYLNIYQADPTTDSAEVQFDISYGTSSVYSGADDYLDAYDPSKAIFSQQQNLLLTNSSGSFPLYDGTTTNEICVINFKRSRVKEGLDPANWELTLSGSSGKVTLVDNSEQASPSKPNTNFGVGEAYYVVSGSLGNDGLTYNTVDYGAWGTVYPDLGIIVLNANELETELGLSFSANDPQGNIQKLYDSIVLGENFTARNVEEISSTHYWVRAKNKKFNFSNNPTWQSGSYGTIKHEEMWNDPKTYITTIGLYDDNNNLVAVAKTNKPVLKSFEDEGTFKIKLNY